MSKRERRGCRFAPCGSRYARCGCRFAPFELSSRVQNSFRVLPKQKNKTWRSSFFILVSRERLELSTPGLKGPCSNQLSYRPKMWLLWLLYSFFVKNQPFWWALSKIQKIKQKKWPATYLMRALFSTLLCGEDAVRDLNPQLHVGAWM